jgi:hypothetical protein
VARIGIDSIEDKRCMVLVQNRAQRTGLIITALTSLFCFQGRSESFSPSDSF